MLLLFLAASRLGNRLANLDKVGPNGRSKRWGQLSNSCLSRFFCGLYVGKRWETFQDEFREFMDVLNCRKEGGKKLRKAFRGEGSSQISRHRARGEEFLRKYQVIF